MKPREILTKETGRSLAEHVSQYTRPGECMVELQMFSKSEHDKLFLLISKYQFSCWTLLSSFCIVVISCILFLTLVFR